MGAGGISQSFPGGEFGFEALPGSDPAVEALATDHADFDLDQVQPDRRAWALGHE
jgi:hypothetical protein